MARSLWYYSYMIKRELKLILNKKQEAQLTEWLWILTGVYNWAIKKIENDARDKVYYSKMDFQNLLSGHSSKVGVPSHVMQGILNQAYDGWQKCFKKIHNKPKMKGIRNKLKSIPFPDPIRQSLIEKKHIVLLVVGRLKYFKQDVPKGKVKCARIIKRASGWYCQLTIDSSHLFSVKTTEEKVGIDTGFKHLAILSNGVKYENRRSFRKNQQRLAQSQRGKNKKLTARIHERTRNSRQDHNHKISRQIVENYSEVFITEDDLGSQARMFGKSIEDAGIGQLRRFIAYKSDNHGRLCQLVNSRNSTKTCSSCGALSGPSGLKGLDVRVWECGCGAKHDRDINAAMNILKLGLGCSLVNLKLSQDK